MKLRKLMAGVIAGALAVSTMSIASFAAIDGADGSGNYIVDVASILPAGADIADVYGVSITFDEASVTAMTTTGAGGGFIFSTKSNNWNSLGWGNEGQDINLDATARTITRMETTPFFTATDISGDEGEYAQIALCQWWGDDIKIEAVNLLDVDGAVIEAAAPEAGEYTMGIGAQFDASVEGNFEEWADTSAWNTTFNGTEGETVTGTFTADFGQMVKFAGNFVGLNTTVPFVEGMEASLTSLKLDGAEIALNDSVLTAEGLSDNTLRLTLTNLWNSDITVQPVDAAVWATSFQTIEIGYSITITAPAEEETTAPVEDETTAPTEDETTAPTEEETTAPEEEDTTAPDTDLGGSEEVPGDSSGNNNNGGNDDTNENTGIALVVIPAIIAGAAATVGGVSLKRKNK